MTAMHTALSDDGKVNPTLLEYFRRRAAGGCGLLIVGASGIDPLRINTHNVIGVYDDRFIPGLKRLADVLHEYDCRGFLQLFHAGRYARSAEYGGQVAVAPSAVPSRFTRETPRELTEDEIGDIIGYYGAAARRALQAGFDGVEITAASGYLPAQFLSPLTNLRGDRYGGELENRLTFLREIIAEVRKTAGEEFPLIVRMGANDFMKGGNTSEESLRIASALETFGADALGITGGWHESGVPQLTMDVPNGFLAYQEKRIKQAVKIPVILSNRMTPKTAEELVDSGSVDFIGFARSFLADPDFPKKAASGRYKEIRPCIGCNQGCMDRIFYGKTISYLVNPEAGRESEFPEITDDEISKRPPQSVLVIGGGVAGLEYALIAASRGHRPTVWERDSTLGGQALLAAGIRERKNIAEYISWLIRSCRNHRIPIFTEKPATAEIVGEALNAGEFDRVVLAAGDIAAESDLETDGSIPVIHAADVLRDRSVAGRRILIAGGDSPGVWTALKLAGRGALNAEQFHFLTLFQAESPELTANLLTDVCSDITIVEEGSGTGEHISPSSRWVYKARLDQLGVKILTKHRILRIRRGSADVMAEDGSQMEIPADAVVETRFLPQEDHLNELLTINSEKVSVIGGSSGRRNMLEAVRAAYEAALAL